MNEPRPEIEVLEPTTTRTGGRAARVTAAVAVGVLLAFVYVGVAGRAPAPPSIPASAPPVIAAASDAPPPTPRSTRTPVGPSEPPVQPFPTDRSGQRPSEFLGAILTLSGRSYVTDLQQVEPNHYVGAYRISRPMPASRGTLELAQMTTKNDARISLGRWDVPLDPLLGYLPTAGHWLEETREPRRHRLDSPTLAQTGYRIAITTDSRAGFAVLSIDVRGGPTERSSGASE